MSARPALLAAGLAACAAFGATVAYLALTLGPGSSSGTALSPSPTDEEESKGQRLSIVEGPEVERPAPPAGAPNVVLVIGCTFRRDQTTVYDPSLPTTPFLAARAADGVVFDDLVNAAPWTKAASTAIITGHHAVSLGMTETSSRRNQKVLPSDVVTVAEAFRDAGWRTFGLTTNPNVHSRMGFAQGFDRYGEPAKLWREKMAKTPGRLAVAAALEWTAELDDPFFLQVLLVDAHAPFPKEPLSDSDGVPETVARYRAGLVGLDQQIRNLAEGLAAAGHDDTIFLVVNDHGEGLEFPAHHGKGHGRYLSSSAVGGIGVAWGPGVKQGGHVRGLSSQIDLAPTLLGLAGIDGWEGPGYDLSPVIAGTRERTPRARAYADTWFLKSSRAAMYSEDQMCQLNFRGDDHTDRHGHTFVDGCFDRAGDPASLRPLRDADAERELRLWRTEQMRIGASRGRVEAIELDDDLDEQLELLGYVEDDEGEGTDGAPDEAAGADGE